MHNHGLGAWMAKRRLKTPDKPALIHGDGETVTYRQLADGTDRVSALLWHRGVRKGDRVAFMGENSPEFIQVLFEAGEEHGVVMIAEDDPGFRIGDRLEIIPNHVCTSVNLLNELNIVRDGHVIDVWPIAARGKVQ